MLDLDALNALIHKHAPVLYMEKHERFQPSSFEAFLKQPGVYFSEGPGKPHTAVPDPLPAGPNPPGTEPYLGYPWNDAQVRRGDPEGAVAYVNAIPWEARGAGGVELQFWFFSPFNGPASAATRCSLNVKTPVHTWKSGDLPLTIDLEPFGEHQGDWEHVSLLFDPDLKPVMMRASEHNYATFYYPPGTPDLPTWTEEDGRPILYSARNGHPTFARPGVIPTRGGTKTFSISPDALGFGFDFTLHFALQNICNSGPENVRLDCRTQHALIACALPGIVVDEPSWLQFMGRCGAVDPDLGDVSAIFQSQFQDGLNAVFDKAHVPHFVEKVLDTIIGKIVEQVAPPVIGLIADKTDNFNGPTMLKAHVGEWTGTAYRRKRIKQPPDPRIYLVIGSQKQLIPDPPTYANLFGENQDIEEDVPLDFLQTGPPLSSGAILAKAPSAPEIYLVTGGVKRLIPSPGVFKSYGFDATRVQTVPDATLEAMPTGAEL